MMRRGLRVLASAGTLLLLSTAASAQKPDGILKIGHFDSPASMSMLEESTAAVNRPMMGVFNNLVIFKQDVRKTRYAPSSRNWPPAGLGMRRALS